jgi:hypothetical protein
MPIIDKLETESILKGPFQYSLWEIPILQKCRKAPDSARGNFGQKVLGVAILQISPEQAVPSDRD